MFKAPVTKALTPKRTLTPKDVEKYVQKVENRLQSPMEKKSKAFAFAKLYADAKDFDKAKIHLEDYLTLHNRDYRVYNLLGEVEESLQNYPLALAAYKRSLELCSTQKEILIKVISLCCKYPIDPLRAKVWADKGARLCSGHPAVFELKWHLLNLEEPKDYEEMELLIADELTRRARDSELHVKLVEMYMEAGSYKRAFMHCQSVQHTNAFNDSLEWLECACDTFDKYRNITKDNQLNANLYYALTLSKLMTLHLKQSTSRVASHVLKRLDKTVSEFCSMDSSDIMIGLSTEWKDCIQELKGQLYIDSAVLIMKLGHEDIISWMKANRMCCALLMASWLVDTPYMTKKLFSRHSPLKRQNQQSYDWSVLACARLSQAGHLLLSMEAQFGDEWIKSCLSDFSTDQGRKKILETLMSNNFSEMYLACDDELLQIEMKIPDPHDLVKYDEVTVAENAQDLHLTIWLGLHWDDIKQHMRPGVGVMVGRLFEGIALDVKNMNNCHFSSMCLRDVEAFIYGVIRSSKSANIECQRADDVLKLLPKDISVCLVTTHQQDWWKAAYGLYTGKVGTQSAAKLKVVLQKGLETLRCLRDHGIDPRILIYMAVAFWEKAASIQTAKDEAYDYQDHWESLQNRAVYYMKEALRILEIYKRDKVLPIVENPLIPSLSEPLLPDEVNTLLNQNYLKLADSATMNDDLHQALKYYEEVKSLQSVYSQAQIYITLASQCNTETIEGEKDYLYYNTKAKDKLQICINHADHSPEFKQGVLDQLQELQTTNLTSTKKKDPASSKKCLDFQDLVANDLNETASQLSYSENTDMSVMLEKDLILQEQLEAKDKENDDLRQQLAMLKTQVENIQLKQNMQMPPHPPHPSQMMHGHHPPMMLPPPPPMYMQPGGAMIQPNNTVPPHPPYAGPPHPPHGHGQPPQQQGPLPHPGQHTGPHTGPHPGQMTPMHGAMPHGQYPPMHPPPQYMPNTPYGSQAMTPAMLPNGLETPTDMWWDSFSPQASFEKGYFAGLAEHVEQVREQSGEGEAPTLRDDSPSTPSPDDEDLSHHSLTKTPKTPTSPIIHEGDDIYVEPIVKLGPKSEVITGEEDEIMKFVHRAKLYRFDKEVGQWKERGIGDVKILYNEKTNKARITMRREAVFRLCCNHAINPDMLLESKENAKAAWSWFTSADASEEQPKPEQFTIKFKTQEIADQFKQVFESMQQLLKNGTPQKGSALSNALSENDKYTDPPSLTRMHTKTSEAADTPKAGTSDSSLFRFKTPENVVTESPEGRPVFNFGKAQESNKATIDLNNPFKTTPATVDLTNPFLTKITSQTNTTPSLPTFNKDSFQPAVTTVVSDVKESPFSGFSFKSTTTAAPSKPITYQTQSSEVQSPAASSSSPFTGFSFSSKPAESTDTSVLSTPGSTPTTDTSMTQKFPMMSSLLQATTPTNNVQKPTGSPETIQGMNKLPVFEKGVIQTGIDPSSFWSSGSPQKVFFTGNKTALDAIGHKEEPRVVDEEEFFQDAMKATQEAEEEEAAANGAQYYGDGYGDEYYYGGEYNEETGEYYGDDYKYYGDYDYDPNEEFGEYDEDDDDDDDLYEDDDENQYQGSKASSSRRNSTDEQLEEGEIVDRQVEDRFDIQKKETNLRVDDVIDDDITITFESKPSFAQKINASRLQLPPSFYLYKTKPPCQGCRGCTDQDSMLYKDDEQNKTKVISTTTTTQEKHQVSSTTFGFGSTSGGATSFASLASSPSGFGGSSPSSGFIGSSGSFAGAGAQLFSSTVDHDDEGVVQDEYDPHYDAIVQVKKLEHVKTGEEDDQVLFKHRAKLYRFDEQWREKGVGDLKVTRNTKTGYCRVIMRRDMIKKLCANHAIMPDMELKPLLTSDKSLVWFTPSDYSEGLPPVPEKFCVKFKNKEVTDQFAEQFEACKKHMEEKLARDAEAGSKQEESYVLTKSSDSPSDVEEKKTEASAKTHFSTKFALKEGEWECSVCLVRNGADLTLCPACQTPNPNASVADVKSTDNEPSFTIGNSTTSKPFFGGMFGQSSENNEMKPFAFGQNTTEQSTFGSSFWNQSNNDQSTFRFGKQPTENDDTQKPLFKFNVENSSSTSSDDKPSFPFDSSKKIVDTPIVEEVKPVEKKQDEPTSPTKYDASEDPDIHVEAIAKVTKLDKVETGEENEESMFTHRAKLYRFDSESKQWKERGIGDVKLSRNINNGSCRVLMRREQIHKLCANHAIVPSMELKPLNKSDKAWQWFTQADCSDDEIKPAQFALRFKTPEIASEFKDAFERCKGIVENRGGAKTEENKTHQQKKETSKTPFSQFAPKPGAWSCPTCYCDNSADHYTCPACETPNPNAPAPQVEAKESSFQFGGAKSNDFTFGQKTEDTAPKFSFGGNQGSTFSFGNQTNQTKPTLSFAKPSGEENKEIPFTFKTSTGSENNSGDITSDLPDVIGKKQEEIQPPASIDNKKISANLGKDVPKVNLADKFAPKPGAWTCSGCYCDNSADHYTCPACETPNPNAPAPQVEAKESSFQFGGFGQKSESTAPTFSFGGNQTSTFSFGSQTNQTKPTFSFATSSSEETKESPKFSFGQAASQNEKEEKPAFSFVKPSEEKSSAEITQPLLSSTEEKIADPTVSSTTGFSFGKTQQSSGFSFGSSSSTPNAGFSFGNTSTSQPAASSSFAFGNNSAPTGLNFGSTPTTSKKEPNVSNFHPDPETWECPSCLAKNAGHRDICRSCSAMKAKTPNVKLDPSEFSQPINFNESVQKVDSNDDVQVIGTGVLTSPQGADSNAISFGSSSPQGDKTKITSMLFIKPNVPPTSPESTTVVVTTPTKDISDGTKQTSTPFSTPKSEPTSGSGFFLAEKKGENALNFWSKSKEDSDRELMPPPSGFPVSKTKTSPSQKTMETSSWMPSGLNTDNLFSFGTTPSPSLSAASSVDDLPSHTSSNVQTAFTNASFSFSLAKPTTPEGKVKPSVDITSPKSPVDEDDIEADVSIEFKPLVTLEQVTLSTGEENEEEIFNERSKMFRFDKQWKERGVGELKILRNSQTQHHRLVMRREQIHKLCANHALLPGMTIKPMSGNNKSFIWKTSADISDEGEPKEQMFAARFKTEEIAQSFADAFTKACSTIPPTVQQTGDDKNTDTTVTSPAEHQATPVEREVIVISDTEETDDDVQDIYTPTYNQDGLEVSYEPLLNNNVKIKAKDLLLPASFYNEPSVKVGSRPSRTYGETSSSPFRLSTSDEKRGESPDLILTHERFSEDQKKNQSSKLMLPNSFYNYDVNTSQLTDESFEIKTEDIQSVSHEEVVYDDLVVALYTPYVKSNEYHEVFTKQSTLYKYSLQAKDFVKVTDGLVIILRDNMKTTCEVLLVADNKSCLRKQIVQDLTIALRPGSKTTIELKFADKERYALHFNDMITAEDFQSELETIIENEQSKINKPSPSSSSSSSSSLLFGKNSGSMSFASVASTGSTGFTSNAGKSFTGAGTGLFGGVQQNNTGDEDGLYNGDEDGNIYVEPIAQVTPVTVTTGEEEEKVVFLQRCKLYGHQNGQWKERGVGELKLLRHLQTGKARLLMRRDRVHKLCANHQLLAAMQLKPFASNELTVTWNAIADMSESTPEDFVVAARFKNQSILSEFKDKFTRLCNGEDLDALPVKVLTNGHSQGEKKQQSVVGSCYPKLSKELAAYNAS